MSSWQLTVNSGQYSSICAQESAYYICSPPQLSEVSSAFSLQSVQLMTAFSLLCKEAHQVIFLSFYSCSPGDWWSHVLGFLPTSSVSSSLFDSIIASSRFPFFYSLIKFIYSNGLEKRKLYLKFLPPWPVYHSASNVSHQFHHRCRLLPGYTTKGLHSSAHEGRYSWTAETARTTPWWSLHLTVHDGNP